MGEVHIGRPDLDSSPQILAGVNKDPVYHLGQEQQGSCNSKDKLGKVFSSRSSAERRQEGPLPDPRWGVGSGGNGNYD